MRILTLCRNYPTKENYSILQYVHTRNKYYLKNGIQIDVLNFSCKVNYNIEGINVYSFNYYKRKLNKVKYDILICHAPNIRNHYIFLKKFSDNFRKIILVFHGHEVLKINSVYPKPYSHIKSNKIRMKFQDLYDCIKLFIWNKYITRTKNKLYYIFVSKWMLKEFIKWTRISPEIIKNRYEIIYNSIDCVFEDKKYDVNLKKEFDFITIRGNIDGSKYCIDLVNTIAKNNLKYKFLIIGKGDYFKYNKISTNITFLNKTMNHEQIINYLNKSSFALMPTRTDAQGVMACEIASYGMNLITSDISVCHEIFDDFNNVFFIDNNEVEKINIGEIINCMSVNGSMRRENKYNFKNTCKKEIKFLYQVKGD